MKTKLTLFAVPLVILLALGGAGAWWANAQGGAETDGDLTQLSMNDDGTQMPQDLPPPEGIEPAAAASDEAAQTPDGPMSMPAAAPVDVVMEGNDPKQPKTLGRADAPVTMTEYASLTCPHCAHAHATILPLLIRDYVNTGKLRIVFSDFPLNAEALAASKVSRCMPNDKYYSFVSLLFSSIEQWAPKVPDSVIQYAVLAGLPADKAKACLNDKGLEDALVQGVQKASTEHQVNATPTFIFNNGAKVIEGAQPYLKFQMTIDGLIEEQKDAADQKK